MQQAPAPARHAFTVKESLTGAYLYHCTCGANLIDYGTVAPDSMLGVKYPDVSKSISARLVEHTNRPNTSPRKASA